MTSVALSLPLASSQSAFKLSDARSARRFVEALQLIRRFNETASKEVLKEAASLLEDCVRDHPKDALPRFYLGVAYSVLGDQKQDFAIKVFKEFAASSAFDIRTVSAYNLAAAYIETYEPELLREGIQVLSKLKDDLELGGAAIGQPSWVHALSRLLRPAKPRVEQMYYQLLETRAYLEIHLDVFVPRWSGDPEKVARAAQHQRKALEGRRTKLQRAERFLGSQGAEIRAWLENNLGMIEEGLAIAALRQTHAGAAEQHAKAADQAYRAALATDPRFTSAYANIGRLNFEVTRNYQVAQEAFDQALSGPEDSDYSQYYVGLLKTIEGNRSAAIRHFSRAPKTVSRYKSEATWTGARTMLANALEKIGRQEEWLRLMDEIPTDPPNEVDQD